MNNFICSYHLSDYQYPNNSVYYQIYQYTKISDIDQQEIFYPVSIFQLHHYYFISVIQKIYPSSFTSRKKMQNTVPSYLNTIIPKNLYILQVKVTTIKPGITTKEDSTHMPFLKTKLIEHCQCN